MSSDLALLVDEVGIAFGRLDDLLLKSCYQLLYSIEGPVLKPFAVEALAIAFSNGQPLAAQELFDRATGDEREALKVFCRVLHFRNYENVGLSGLQMYFNADPNFSPADVDHLAALLSENRIDAALAVCEITEAAAPSAESLLRLGEGLRRIGVRVAVDDFGAGASTTERVRLLKPSTVKIDARWFQTVSRNVEASAMLPDLFARMHELGSRVLVEGIETPDDLACALSAGADYLQGYLLSRPALAGTIFDDAPISIQEFLPARTPRLHGGMR